MTEWLVENVLQQAMNEILAARDYACIAKKVDSEQDAMKFIEMAKEELKHFDFDHNYLVTKLQPEMKNMDMFSKALHNSYERWAEDVRHMVNDFKYVKH